MVAGRIPLASGQCRLWRFASAFIEFSDTEIMVYSANEPSMGL